MISVAYMCSHMMMRQCLEGQATPVKNAVKYSALQARAPNNDQPWSDSCDLCDDEDKPEGNVTSAKNAQCYPATRRAGLGCEKRGELWHWDLREAKCAVMLLYRE